MEADVLTHLGKGKIILDMNVTNSYAIAALLELGYEKVGLSDEMRLDQIEQTLDAFEARYEQKAPVIVCVYQKRRLMLMNHCPVNTLKKTAGGLAAGCATSTNTPWKERMAARCFASGMRGAACGCSTRKRPTIFSGWIV